MFTVALFIIAKTWKPPTCLWIDKWIKMRCIYMMEYYSAFKNNEILPFGTPWIELESIMLSEISEYNANSNINAKKKTNT